MSIARTAATGGALDPEFLEWQTSLPYDHRLLDVDVAGSVAHVKGLLAAGLVTEDEAKTLTDGLEAIPAKVVAGELELPLEEDVHMAIEVLLKQAVGDVANKLHTGRSRNDQVATDLKLWSRAAVARLDKAFELLESTVRAWKSSFGETPMAAYTHRQVAIPVLASMWIDAALTLPLARDKALLEAVNAELADSPLGAGAIGGSTLPLRTDVTSEALGFQRGPQNPLDAVGQRDHAITLAFVCARVGLHLGRFCADVVEMSSDGLVKLGGAVACGSSMMPHKRNPDLFELVRAQSALRQGELMQLVMTFQGLGTGYHRDLQQDKQVLFASVDGTLACLKMITLGIEHLELLAEPCMHQLRQGDAVATDLTEALVERGVAFRDAYRQVGALVASQRDKGKRLVDLSADDLEAAGISGGLVAVLDPAASAERRAMPFRK